MELNTLFMPSYICGVRDKKVQVDRYYNLYLQGYTGRILCLMVLSDEIIINGQFFIFGKYKPVIFVLTTSTTPIYHLQMLG